MYVSFGCACDARLTLSFPPSLAAVSRTALRNDDETVSLTTEQKLVKQVSTRLPKFNITHQG